jgi:hypothetical protein
MSVTMASFGNERPLRPGFLVGPLGWLNERLTKTLTSDRELFVSLFELDPYRMHVLGLGMAHHDGEPSSEIVKSLVADPPKSALGPLIGYCPNGLGRALRALPQQGVLTSESYRALVSLLNEPPTANYLHHCRAITEPMIVGLAALPGPLRRPAIFKLFGQIEGTDGFISGLKFLSARAAIAFDDLVEHLGSFDQPEQVIAKITDLAESLPLPDRLPDPRIGPFVRLDNIAEIRSLAKAWHNCLVNHLYEVNEGTKLIYLSIEDGLPAVALVVRVHRLGWALAQIKGPRNIDLDRIEASRKSDKFAAAGIPRLADVAAVKDLLWRRQFLRGVRG